MKNAHKVLILNNKIVRERLRQKKYDDVCLTPWEVWMNS